MSEIIKRPFRSFNGTDWDKHYFETSADQVKYTESDGSEIELQAKIEKINDNIVNILRGMKSVSDCNDAIGNYGVTAFANFDGTGNAPSGEVRGLVFSIAEFGYPTAGYALSQIFVSYYGTMYVRTVISGQSYGTWTQVDNSVVNEKLNKITHGTIVTIIPAGDGEVAILTGFSGHRTIMACNGDGRTNPAKILGVTIRDSTAYAVYQGALAGNIRINWAAISESF